jgi:hypothetical protein
MHGSLLSTFNNGRHGAANDFERRKLFLFKEAFENKYRNNPSGPAT